MVRNFEFLEPARIAVSGFPESAAAVDWLHDQGIHTVVSLHPIPDDARERLREREMLWLDFPITDFSEGIPDEFDVLLDRIEEELTGDGAVLIHCQGGGGRSRAVYASLLVNRGERPAAAIAAAGVEKDVQKAFVHGFYHGCVEK